MKTREFQLSYGTVKLTGHAAPISDFVKGIRESRSTKPHALPLRGKSHSATEFLRSWLKDGESVADELQCRAMNENHCESLRREFLKKLELDSNVGGGLYFLASQVGQSPCYSYIGITDGLCDRVNKHLITKDFIFYALAFPENHKRYKREVLGFYGRNYKSCRAEYKLEFECVLQRPITTILWVSSNDFNREDWKEIETNFISFQSNYDPCSNIDKTEREFSVDYLEEFYAVEEFLALLWKG